MRAKLKYILIIIFLLLGLFIIGVIRSKTNKSYQITFIGENGNECCFLLNYRIKNEEKNLYKIDDFGFIKFMIYKILPLDELENNIDRTISYLQKRGKYPNKFHTVEKYGWKGKKINVLIDEEEWDTYNYTLAKGNYYLFFTLIKNKGANIEVTDIADEILTSFRPISPIINKKGNDYLVNFLQNDRYYQLTIPHFSLIGQNKKAKLFAAVFNDIPMLVFTTDVYLIPDSSKKQNKESILPSDLYLARSHKINGWRITFWCSYIEKTLFCSMRKRENSIFIQTLESVEEKNLESIIDKILELLSTLKINSFVTDHLEMNYRWVSFSTLLSPGTQNAPPVGTSKCTTLFCFNRPLLY